MLAPAVQLLVELFEPSPNVYFCVKDTSGRYLSVSEMFVRRMGHPRFALVGRTADDVCPPDLARLYRAEDQALLATGLARTNKLETVADVDGRRSWFLTNRTLYRAEGFDDVIVAISTPTDLGSRSVALGVGLRQALDLAERRDRGPLRVADLAAEAGLSSDQLDRVMRRVLGVSPKQFLMAVRADHAASLLASTDLSIAEIARRCHYYDQSQFSNHFKATFGVTPGQFRSSP